MPIEKNGRYIFSAGDLAVEIDPRVGGRVVSISLGVSMFYRMPSRSTTTGRRSDELRRATGDGRHLQRSTTSLTSAQFRARSWFLRGHERWAMRDENVPLLDAATSSLHRICGGQTGAAPSRWRPGRSPACASAAPPFPTGTKIYDYGNVARHFRQPARLVSYDAAAITTDCKSSLPTPARPLAQVDGNAVLVKNSQRRGRPARTQRSGYRDLRERGAHLRGDREPRQLRAGRPELCPPCGHVRWSLRSFPPTSMRRSQRCSGRRVKQVAAE
jgi:hypothetical protein